MNLTSIFKNMPLLGEDKADEVDPEVAEVAAKKERIDFHRRSVRNGPVAFKTVTNGQLRRAKVRELRRNAKRARRAQVRDYFAAQREGATIRGHLESVGLMQEIFDRPAWEINIFSAYRSSLWLIKHFAPVEAGTNVEVTEDLVRSSFRAALNRWQVIVGLPATDLPTSYELPVSVAA